MYNEDSAENKRSRMKDSSISVFSTKRLSSVFMILSEIVNLLNSNATKSSQFISSYFISSTLSQQTVVKFKKKDVKRVDKKIESQFLIEMFNFMTNVYNKSISIRQLLKKNKIDLN